MSARISMADLTSAILRDLKNEPMGILKTDFQKRYGVIHTRVDNALINIGIDGHLITEDGNGGVFLVDVRERHLEKLRGDPHKYDGRRRGKLCATFTGNS